MAKSKTKKKKKLYLVVGIIMIVVGFIFGMHLIVLPTPDYDSLGSKTIVIDDIFDSRFYKKYIDNCCIVSEDDVLYRLVNVGYDDVDDKLFVGDEIEIKWFHRLIMNDNIVREVTKDGKVIVEYEDYDRSNLIASIVLGALLVAVGCWYLYSYMHEDKHSKKRKRK
ncbi:MAG: hypothetical protein IJW04_08010 [Ruminococcus sp.]|nr:hypothetical protein [Ruminococcus sp.]